MRQIGIRQLRASLNAQLQDLPFQVTHRGKVIASIGTNAPMCTHDDYENLLSERKLLDKYAYNKYRISLDDFIEQLQLASEESE